MPVSAIEFVTKYIEWLEVIDHVVKPEYYPAMRQMYCIDPHDLISPFGCFASEHHAIGTIWCIMLEKHKENIKEIKDACIR